MINILIRTHNRPDKLRECIKSIKMQTYKKWHIIISADNDRAEKYTKPYGYEYIRTDKIKYQKRKEKSRMRKYWNVYLNVLQGRAKEGFIIYMDEDMVLYTENSLQLVADNSHEDKLLIFKPLTPFVNDDPSSFTLIESSVVSKPPSKSIFTVKVLLADK
ncbi:hypothetical protein LCGC14_2964460, partial [marine sediment metagenome]